MHKHAFRGAILTALLAAAGCAGADGTDTLGDEGSQVTDDVSPAPQRVRADSTALSDVGAAQLLIANRVSLVEARALAERFARENAFASAQVADSDVELDDGGSEPVMYVFNFVEGGFVLVAADKRQQAVL